MWSYFKPHVTHLQKSCIQNFSWRMKITNERANDRESKHFKWLIWIVCEFVVHCHLYIVDNLFCNHTLWAFCYHYHYRHNYYDLVIKFMKCIRLLKGLIRIRHIGLNNKKNWKKTHTHTPSKSTTTATITNCPRPPKMNMNTNVLMFFGYTLKEKPDRNSYIQLNWHIYTTRV